MPDFSEILYENPEETIVRIVLNRPEARNAQGTRMLYELKRFDRALQVLDRAVELDPRDPTPVFLQAIIYRDTNRYGEAIYADRFR